MTVAIIQRGPITDRLISELEELGLPVGDNKAPTDPYGWQGEPNANGSNFIPWVVLTAGTTPAPTGSFGGSQDLWRMPYTVFYGAVTRKQLDWLADRMRNKFVNIERESVATDTGSWRIQQIRCTAVGGSIRVSATTPDYYTQTDVYEVWLAKEL